MDVPIKFNELVAVKKFRFKYSYALGVETNYEAEDIEVLVDAVENGVPTGLMLVMTKDTKVSVWASH